MNQVKYKRKFACDKSISKGIQWLNKKGYYTIGCCSGLEKDHKNSERDRMYVEFESLNSDKIIQIKILACEFGFKIKDLSRKNIRIETENENKLEMFNNFIWKLRKNKTVLGLRTIGISNWAYDSNTKKRYSIQFYDYDFNGENKISRSDLLKILEIFPYDVLMYETKHGIHFISFAILHGLNITKSRVLKTSKALGKQDYWTESKDLTLRASAKWKPRKFRNYKTISERPKFKGLIRGGETFIISKKHLEFYKKYMALPFWVYNQYNACVKKDYKIKIYHYKTRD